MAQKVQVIGAGSKPGTALVMLGGRTHYVDEDHDTTHGERDRSRSDDRPEVAPDSRERR